MPIPNACSVSKVLLCRLNMLAIPSYNHVVWSITALATILPIIVADNVLPRSWLTLARRDIKSGLHYLPSCCSDHRVGYITPYCYESWTNNDITYAELGLEGYVMFRKDRMGRRGGGVLLYINEAIPAYEVQLQEEADCNEAIWCKLVTGHTTVTIGVVYRCPNITKQNNEKIHNSINEVSKGDCIIMGDFNHGTIKWDTLQSTGVEDSTFLCLVQDNFLTQHVLEPTRATRVLDIVLSSQKELVATSK